MTERKTTRRPQRGNGWVRGTAGMRQSTKESTKPRTIQAVPKRQFGRVMAANRGEIAIRVFRACTELHKGTIAIYSEQDSLSLHRYKADEAYLVGKGKGPIQAYLDMEGIIEIARRAEVDAIHPGYGFLAENPDFAQMCIDSGIGFIGPRPEHLKMFGDKMEARRLAVEARLPVIPGTETPVETHQEALLFAKNHGYPIIVKAVAGGGGRGMRVVRTKEELVDALDRAGSEAAAAFGSKAVYLEKFLEQPKHIEVQVLADASGHTVHLFERDCSIQRRHQKMVEFAPSLTLDGTTRTEMCAAAVRLMKSVDYVNAGTVEFLLDQEGNYYFLEVNPRIQVEHTVTELVTGVDLVQAQIRIAEGYALHEPEIGIQSQEHIQRHGYAIQCRVTTEDPENNFLPDTGRILAYRTAAGFGVRLDAGNGHAGAQISPYYDSLLVKISTWALRFDNAAAKMLRSLKEFRLRGVKTNIPFLENVVQHPRFLKGDCDTTFVDTTPELYVFPKKRDRGTKVLSFIGHVTVNGGPGVPKMVEKRPFRVPKVPETRFDDPYPEGTRQILEERGPEGLSRWILDQKTLLLTDTTFRDAHQSLLATRVRSYDLLRVAEATGKLAPQLFSMEVWGGATFDVAMRFLKECPWERLINLRARIPNILFQMLLRASNAVGYTNYPDNVIRLFVKEAAAAGIDIFRIFDSLNWIEGMRVAIDAVRESGKVVEAAVCYTGDISDPKRQKYSLKYYVELAKELEKTGAHILCIKDMAGLLKPRAAGVLFRALKEEINIPIHFHTHDTSGNGVASILQAAEAGVDIADVALSSMSGLTSQPSLNAVVSALTSSERAPNLDLDRLQLLANYWEDVREYYFPFESGLKAGTAEVYKHEIPGGQYSNLRPQAEALGLGDRWEDIKETFAVVNRMLGDIVKVTPSSKVVGDLALFMVKNNLTEQDIYERGETLTFPDSVVGFFEGMLGQPPGGFPEKLQKLVLKGREPITCRPGELLEPVDFESNRDYLEKKLGRKILDRDLASHALYPTVFEEFCLHRDRYSDTSVIDTPTFFYGLRLGEETAVEIERGKMLIVKLTAIGELLPDGSRVIYFELNGQPREVRVPDESATATVRVRPKAEPGNPAHLGAPMPGKVLKVSVRPGARVKKGQQLLVTEAMKMETTIQAPDDGIVEKIVVTEGEMVEAGDLLVIWKNGG